MMFYAVPISLSRAPEQHFKAGFKGEEKAGIVMSDKASTEFMISLRYRMVPEWLKNSKRWLVYKLEAKAGGKSGKIPYYTDGNRRQGILDSAEDNARLGTFKEAIVACTKGQFDGLGFALGRDSDGQFWQGVDLDKVKRENSYLLPLVDELQGYVEISPSGDGYHAIGKGAYFNGGHKGQGIEAYASARFFTVTGKVPDGGTPSEEPVDLKPWLMQKGWAKLDDRYRDPNDYSEEIFTGIPEQISDDTRKELLSALMSINGSEYDVWSNIGQALHSVEGGYEMWHAWSRAYPSRTPISDDELRRKWDELPGDRTNYRSIFKQAQALGWINPRSKGAAGNLMFDAEVPKRNIFKIERTPLRGNEIEPILNASWLVKNVIPKTGIGIIYGAPSSAKTFFALDFTCRYVSPKYEEWEGNKIKRGNTLQAGYCFLEGGFFAGNRVAAWKQVYGNTLDNLLVFPYPLSFTADEEMENIIKHVKDAGGVDMLVIDTLARAMSGVDENSAEGMSRAIDAADRLARELNCFVLVVHHTGKDKERGARGHSSLKGAIDLEIFVDRVEMSEYRTVKVEKVKDGRDGSKTAFKLNVIEIGSDEDGDAVTSCVIESCPLEEAESASTSEEAPIVQGLNTKLWNSQMDEMLQNVTERGFGGCILKAENGGNYTHPTGYENYRRVNLQDIMEALNVRNNNRRADVKNWLLTKYETVNGWVIIREKDQDLSFVSG